MNYKEDTMKNESSQRSLPFISPTSSTKKRGKILKPLQWNFFSSKLPKNKELIVIAEKYQNSAIYNYNIGIYDTKTHIITVGMLLFKVNKKTGKKKYALTEKLTMQQIPHVYQINEDPCYWISMTDILKYKKKILINKSNINMNIVMIKQYHNICGIHVGKITNINRSEIEITSRYFEHEGNIKSAYQFSIKKKSIVQWTKLPNLPNNPSS